MANDKPSQTFLVALILCLVCSLGVSAFAVLLQSAQERNKLLDKQKNVLEVSGLSDKENLDNSEIERLFESIKTYAVDLDTGEKITNFNVAEYDAKRASRELETSVELSDNEDIVSIGRRENISLIYEVYDAKNNLDAIVLPIRGYGLWSTLYGFLALEEDGVTVRGVTFYEHAETPGLGGEVDNKKWKAHWQGKVVFSSSGDLVLEVVKGRSRSNTEIDGLSGATITSQGVNNMLLFWLGERGYKKYIDKNLKNS